MERTYTQTHKQMEGKTVFSAPHCVERRIMRSTSTSGCMLMMPPVSYPNKTRKTLRANLHTAKEWADRWFIKFNPQKTESLNLSRKRDQQKPSILFNGTEIQEVEHRHLGIILQIKCKIDIQEISKRA